MSLELPRQSPENNNESSSTNELFMFFYLPSVMILVGGIEVLLGVIYGHYWGVFIGLLAVGFSILLLRSQPRELAEGWVRATLLMFFLYLSLLVFVRLVSYRGSVDFSSKYAGSEFFPEECPPEKILGCVRIATKNSHFNENLEPLAITVHVQDTISLLEKWVAQEGSSTKVLLKRWEPMDSILTTGKSKCTVYYHIRALTFFMGFADDLYVNMECFKNRPQLSESHVLISAQSQLRIGKGDLGVNKRRVDRLFQFLNQKLAQVEKGDCTTRLATESN